MPVLPEYQAVTFTVRVTAWYAGKTGIPSSHLHRLIIPDDVLIQFDLLMMSAVTIETCRDMKKCVKLVISKNFHFVVSMATKEAEKYRKKNVQSRGKPDVFGK